MRLSNKLLGQGYVKKRLKSSLRKFCGRYGDLTKQYEVPLSRMLHDILDDDHIRWHPPLIGHYTNFWPLLIWTLLPNLTFYLIVQGFHRTYATGAACQQRTLTPPDTWSCPTLGLACVLMSWTCLVSGFWISNTPRYFSFASKAGKNCPKSAKTSWSRKGWWNKPSKQTRSTEGCSKLKRCVDMTSSGKNGLNIRTNASPKWDRTRCPKE